MSRTVLGFGLICVGAFLLAAVMIAQGLAASTTHYNFKGPADFCCVIGGLASLLNFVLGYGCLISNRILK